MATSGAPIRLRPVVPDDEALLQDLAAHMSAEDLRLRFFAPLRGLPHELAARLAHVDYAREMALIALPQDGETALGVARFATEADPGVAEFAIAVRSDWKHRGVGHVLMARLIEIARARGIARLDGEVLHENQAMLQFCRGLGFTVAHEPDDPALFKVSLVLAKA